MTDRKTVSSFYYPTDNSGSTLSQLRDIFLGPWPPPAINMSSATQSKISLLTPQKKLEIYCQSQKHPFHILDASPYPFLVSFFLLALLIPVTFYLHGIEIDGFITRSDLIHSAFIGLYLVAMF